MKKIPQDTRQLSKKRLRPSAVETFEKFTNQAAVHKYRCEYFDKRQEQHAANKEDRAAIFKERLRKVDWTFVSKRYDDLKPISSHKPRLFDGRAKHVRLESKARLNDLLLKENTEDSRVDMFKGKKRQLQIAQLNKTLHSMHRVYSEDDQPVPDNKNVLPHDVVNESFLLQTIKRRTASSLNASYANMRQTGVAHFDLNRSSLKNLGDSSMHQLGQQNGPNLDLTDNSLLIEAAKVEASKTGATKPSVPKVYHFKQDLRSISHLTQIDEEISKRLTVLGNTSKGLGVERVEKFMVDSSIG